MEADIWSNITGINIMAILTTDIIIDNYHYIIFISNWNLIMVFDNIEWN